MSDTPASRHSSDDEVEQGAVFEHKADLADPPMGEQQRWDHMEAAHQLIRAKYDAGVPFFTKEVIRSVVEQLDAGTQTIAIKGLDGLDIHFPVETGKNKYVPHLIQRLDGSSTKPHLGYTTAADLLSDDDADYYSVSFAYLPVDLVHSTEVRDAQTNEIIPPWPSLSDPAAVSLRFAQARQTWDESELFARIRSALDSAVVPPGTDKVVTLACSTVSWAGDMASHGIAQHALALTIRDWLAARQPEVERREIKCYAQDPIYTPVDEQALAEAGIIAVDDPRAFLHVDEASAVISFSPNIPVRRIVADLARPALIIWNKVEKEDLDKPCTDPVSTRVLEMMEEYVELPFPGENDEFFNGAIYVRKAQGSGDV